MAKVRIPTPLRNFTQGKDEVQVSGNSIGDLLKNLSDEYKGIGDRILDKTGQVNRFINVFVNEDDIRHGDGMKTAVKDEDVISIFPAIAGGRASKNYPSALLPANSRSSRTHQVRSGRSLAGA